MKRGQYTNFRCAGHWDCISLTENLNNCLKWCRCGGRGGGGEEQALHFLHQLHRPLMVGETGAGRKHSRAVGRPLIEGEGTGNCSLESGTWLTLFKNKKTLPEMEAFCYIPKWNTYYFPRGKIPSCIWKRKINGTYLKGGLCKLCATQMKFKYYFWAV